MTRRPRRSTLFPYTTLFRSADDEAGLAFDDVVQQRAALEPELLHPVLERRDEVRPPVRITDRTELLQPVDLAAQLPQPQSVLQIHPEMPAAVRETGDLVHRQDDSGHGASLITAATRCDTSRNPISAIPRSWIARRTRGSHSVRSSISRSAR